MEYEYEEVREPSQIIAVSHTEVHYDTLPRPIFSSIDPVPRYMESVEVRMMAEFFQFDMRRTQETLEDFMRRGEVTIFSMAQWDREKGAYVKVPVTAERWLDELERRLHGRVQFDEAGRRLDKQGNL